MEKNLLEKIVRRILANLQQELKQLFKKFEYKSKKLIKKECSHKFNEICLNEYLID